MAMSWRDAAEEADRVHPPQAAPDRTMLAEAREIRAEATAAITTVAPMLDAAFPLLLRRWPMDTSDWNPQHLMPRGHMPSKSLEGNARNARGILFGHGGDWQLKDPAVTFHMQTFATGRDGSIHLPNHTVEPSALTELLSACRAAQEWVPVELVLTLRAHGLPLPSDQ